MTILGFHILHKWGKWEDCSVALMSVVFSSHWFGNGQKRVCKECGVSEVRA
jgi:hypothetical protein